MTTDHSAWLELTKEEALEPALPICDPHHHIWDYPDKLGDSAVPFFAREPRHYLLNDLLEDIGGGHNIVKTVFMECNSMYRKGGPPELVWVGETEFVNGIAAQSLSGLYGNTEVAAGIVGFADLAIGDSVARTLEAHLAASGRFRGVRYISIWDAANNMTNRSRIPKLLSDSNFRKGFAKLHRYGLSFDAMVLHPQLEELTDLARAFPDTPIILNHIGCPLGIGTYAGKRDEVFHDWMHGIASLSSCPNVSVKLGGMGMAMMGFGWHQHRKPPTSQELAEGMTPYLSWCIEKFGTDRCMFESNFPVDRVSYPYTVIWNAFKRFSRGFSASERSALFHDTAAKVYRLG